MYFNGRSLKLILLLFAFTLQQQLWGQGPIGLKTVVIDAGHGGKDPGALGKKIREKDVTLQVSLLLGQLIQTQMPEVKVVYTRKTDVFVPLDKRAEIANKHHADLFISIHVNSISNPNIVGAETFVLGLHRSTENLEVAKKENAVIVLEDDYVTKYEGFDPNSQESYIIFELMQNTYLDQSIQAASAAQHAFSQTAKRYNRGVKQAGFLVLRQTAMPGILVELGFLSNQKEEEYLGSPQGQAALAKSLFSAFVSFKQEYDAQNAVPQNVLPKAENVSEKTNADLVFRVQVGSSRELHSKGKGVFALFPEADHFSENNLYKYTYGSSSDYNEALRLQKKAREKVPDSFVIAFYKGKKITIKEALELSNTKTK